MVHRVPDDRTLAIGAAIGRHAPLADLLRRVHESQDWFADIRPLLPPELAAAVQPGPLDDRQWTLLASHNAAAAKLRQLLPRCTETLLSRGRRPVTLRVRIARR